MPNNAEMLAEAYRRNLLPADKRANYEEAMRRGMVPKVQPARQRNVWDDVTGAVQTAVKTVPFADEVNDYVHTKARTALDLLTDDTARLPGETKAAYVKRMTGRSAQIERQNWEAQRAKSRKLADDFTEAHPRIKPVVEFGAMAAPVVAAAATGGASAAPTVAANAPAATRGLMAAAQQAPSLVRKTVNAAADVGKAGLVGALAGALQGAGEGETLDERAENSNLGLLTGAVTGGGLVPLVRGTAGAANAVRKLLTPAEDRAAAQAGRVLAARAPEAQSMAPADEGGIQLPFERMGPGGETVARAVASVPGPGQNMAREALTQRGQGARARMMDSVRRELGDGAEFHPTREALDKRRLTDSQPLYREAFDVEPPVTNTLERLKSRPSIREAMQRGAKLAREAGEDPNALGLFHMENDAGWVSHEPPTARTTREAERVAGFRPPRAPTQGPSLSKFVADSGGIRDVGGDVAHMGGGEWHRGKAYQRGLIKDTGDDIDSMALRAWEQGYFPRHQTRPTVNEFLDALGEDIAGRRRIYAREADPYAADRVRRADEADEMAYRGGSADDLPDPDSYGGRPEPQTGPVYGETPTFKAWDYVKRGLDDLIEGSRNEVTGKLPRSDEVRGWENTRRELREHLRDINPVYGDALDAYSGPSRQMHALGLGRRMVEGNMDVEDLEEGLGKMSADELDSLRLGIARGLSDKFRRSDPQKAFRQFMNDELVQDRLRVGFGNDANYSRFMRDVANEFEAQLSRNRILTGSRTTPLAEEIAAVNEAADDGGMLAVGLRAAKDGRGLRQQAFGWAVEKMQQAMAAKSGLNNPEVSRLLGQALFRAGDPADLFEAMVRARVVSPEEVQAIMPYLAAVEGQSSGRTAAAGPR